MINKLPSLILLLAICAAGWQWHAHFFLPRGEGVGNLPPPQPMERQNAGALAESLILNEPVNPAYYSALSGLMDDGRDAPAILKPPVSAKAKPEDLAKLVDSARKMAGGMGNTSALATLALPTGDSGKTQAIAAEAGDQGSTETAKQPESFPLVFTGLFSARQRQRALIEDVSTGTSYFRTEGEKLGDYTVLRVSKEMVVLLDTGNGRHINLLPAKRGKR